MKRVLGPKCACGCGKKLKTIHGKNRSKFVHGHYVYGIGGWVNRMDRYNWKGYGSGRNKQYPAKELVAEEHSEFLSKYKINPEFCWGCQRDTFLFYCHIVAVAHKGSNRPENLLLLCGGCHFFQGMHSDLLEDWDLQQQYDWLSWYRLTYEEREADKKKKLEMYLDLIK